MSRSRKVAAIFGVIIFALAIAAGCARQKEVVKEEEKGTAIAKPAPEAVKPAEQEAEKKAKISEEELPAQKQAREFKFLPDEALKDVYFDFDKSDLTPAARETLRKNADALKKNSGAKVQVEGHADERGTAEYNLALGERRASAVRKYLADLGINPDNIFTLSYGEERPADPRHNDEAWAKNRRAHFLVASK